MGKDLGRAFQQLVLKQCPNREGKDFHSFRHTVIDELKQLGEPKELVSELGGDVVKDTTLGRYGKNYSVHVLSKVVEKQAYGVDLSRIRNFIAKSHEKCKSLPVQLR